MKKILLLIITIAGIFLTAGTTYSQPPEFLRAKQSVSYPNCFGNGVAVDPASGDIFIAGYFAGTGIFDTVKLDSKGNTDIFVARYNNYGGLVWIQQAGGTSATTEAYAIARDASDNSIVVVGSFTGEANFGAYTLTSVGDRDIFIAKYKDVDGTTTWVKQAGETGDNRGYGVATDASGNIYVTGRIYSKDSFFDVFIAKYNADGVRQWEKNAGGTGEDIGNGIAIDGSGNIVVTGSFYGTATFGKTELESADGTDVFVAKYDPNGSLIWAKSAGGIDDDRGYGIAVDGSDNIVVTGEFAGEAGFDGDTLTSVGGKDLFVAGYDASGNRAFAVCAGSTGDDAGNAVAVDSSGNLLVTGEFSGTVDFGSTQLTSAGAKDIFIAKYNSSGNPLFALKAGGIEDDAGQGVAVNEDDGIVAVGEFHGTALFGNMTLISPAQNELFLATIGEPSLVLGLPGDFSRDGRVGLEDVIGILQILSRCRQ